MNNDVKDCIAILDAILRINQNVASLILLPLSNKRIRNKIFSHYTTKGGVVEFHQSMNSDTPLYFVDVSMPLGDGGGGRGLALITGAKPVIFLAYNESI